MYKLIAIETVTMNIVYVRVAESLEDVGRITNKRFDIDGNYAIVHDTDNEMNYFLEEIEEE